MNSKIRGVHYDISGIHDAAFLELALSQMKLENPSPTLKSAYVGVSLDGGEFKEVWLTKILSEQCETTDEVGIAVGGRPLTKAELEVLVDIITIEMNDRKIDVSRWCSLSEYQLWEYDCAITELYWGTTKGTELQRLNKLAENIDKEYIWQAVLRHQPMLDITSPLTYLSFSPMVRCKHGRLDRLVDGNCFLASFYLTGEDFTKLQYPHLWNIKEDIDRRLYELSSTLFGGLSRHRMGGSV